MTTIRAALLAVNAATGATLVEKLVNMGLNCEMDAVALQGIKEEDLNLEYGEKVTLRAAQKQQGEPSFQLPDAPLAALSLATHA